MFIQNLKQKLKQLEITNRDKINSNKNDNNHIAVNYFNINEIFQFEKKSLSYEKQGYCVVKPV